MTGQPIDYPRPRLEDRLKWAHGPERAREIMAGTDANANADLKAWNSLGHPIMTARTT